MCEKKKKFSLGFHEVGFGKGRGHGGSAFEMEKTGERA